MDLIKQGMTDPKIWTCNPVFNQFKYVPVMTTEVPYWSWDNQIRWRREQQPLRVYEFSHVYKCHDIKIND